MRETQQVIVVRRPYHLGRWQKRFLLWSLVAIVEISISVGVILGFALIANGVLDVPVELRCSYLFVLTPMVPLSICWLGVSFWRRLYRWLAGE